MVDDEVIVYLAIRTRSLSAVIMLKKGMLFIDICVQECNVVEKLAQLCNL